jgi:hypothetical protein
VTRLVGSSDEKLRRVTGPLVTNRRDDAAEFDLTICGIAGQAIRGSEKGRGGFPRPVWPACCASSYFVVP